MADRLEAVVEAVVEAVEEQDKRINLQSVNYELGIRNFNF